MVWMVFYGKPRAKLHAHEAGTAMKTALAPLAAGTLLTWLLAGPFSKLLETTLPHHALEAHSTLHFLEEVILAPATLIAMAVIALGLAAWWQRERLQGLVHALRGLARAATDSFGFEAINRGIVRATQNSAENLRVTQTGLVSWNILGIMAGLVLVLVILLLGA